MPTATPFKLLGKGNGFPFCTTELAVEPVDGNLGMYISDYNSLYASSGGTFSALPGNLKFSQPFSNILDAMPFFYNSYSLNVSSSVSITLGQYTSSGTFSNQAILQEIEITPKNRTCHSSYPFFKFPKFININNAVGASITFDKIYFYGTGSNKKYYWGITSFYINPRSTTSWGYFQASSYYNIQNLYEYNAFDLSITSFLKIPIAFYSSQNLDSVTSTASVNSVNYYTY